MSKFALLRPLLVLAALPAYGDPAWEPEPLPPVSSLSLDYLTDSGEGWNRQLGVSLSGPMRLQFNLVYGENFVDSAEAELNTDYQSIGIVSDPLNPFSAELAFERWGRDDSLTIDTWRLALSYNARDFSLTLIPQQRSIMLAVRESIRPQAPPHVEVDGNDIGIRLGYYGWPDWSLSGEYVHYGYSRDPARLASDFRVLWIFPLETLELAGGLDARQTRLSATRFLSAGEVGFEWLRATSAVDGGRADVGTLYTAIELTSAWTLRLQGGAQRVDYEGDSIYFAGLGVDYFW